MEKLVIREGNLHAQGNWTFVQGSYTGSNKVFTFWNETRTKVGDKWLTDNGEFTVTAVTSVIPFEDWMYAKRIKTLEDVGVPASLASVFNKKEVPMSTKCRAVELRRSVVRLTERTLDENPLFIDGKNTENSLLEALASVGKNYFPSKVYVKNFKMIDTHIVEVLIKAYVYGAKIGIHTEGDDWKVFENPNPKKRFDVAMIKLRTNEIPSRLAKMYIENKIKVNGKYMVKKMTFIDILEQSGNLEKYIPHDAWDMIDKYNDMIFKGLNAYNKFIDFEKNAEFEKTMYKMLKGTRTGVKIGNKLHREAEGEIMFSRMTSDIESTPILTQEQREFLYANARYYGVEIPRLRTRMAFEKTSEGYAQYPERVLANGMSIQESELVKYDPRRKNGNLPKHIRQEFIVKENDDYAGEKQAYDSLMWFINNGGDEWLIAPYARCPQCGAIYNKDSGVCRECGHTDEWVVLSESDLEAQKAQRKQVREQLSTGTDEESVLV